MHANPDLPLFPTVVVVGLGNIGSHTTELLARLPSIRRVIPVDPDTYSETNRRGQQIRAGEVGQPKALVQARRLRDLNPDLDVIPFIEDIANVPVGWLRHSVVLGCVDSILARNAITEAVWRAGATWIDGGVEPASGLSRVSVFAPGPGAPCFECGLEPEDYENLQTRHLCAASPEAATPTDGNFGLGSLTAALMVMQLENLLSDGPDRATIGHQCVLDGRHFTQFNTRLARNPGCRFHHQTCSIQPLTGVTEDSPVREALAVAQRLFDRGRAVSLSLPGRAFARALHCPNGCESVPTFAVPARLPPKRRRCAQCGRERQAAGAEQLERLTASALSVKLLRRPLRAIGLRAGDVLTAGDGEREMTVEIPNADGSLVGSLGARSEQENEKSDRSENLTPLGGTGHP